MWARYSINEGLEYDTLKANEDKAYKFIESN